MLMTQRPGWLLVMAGLVAGCGSSPTAPPAARDQLAFGISMAQRGLWSEAHFRFEQAARGNPRDPRILNNLAVANEALGNFDAALESYRAALSLAPGDSDLKGNYDRFVSFYESFRARQEAELAQAPIVAGAWPEPDGDPPGESASDDGPEPAAAPDPETVFGELTTGEELEAVPDEAREAASELTEPAAVDGPGALEGVEQTESPAETEEAEGDANGEEGELDDEDQ